MWGACDLFWGRVGTLGVGGTLGDGGSTLGADEGLSNGEGVLGLAVGKGFSTVMRWVLGHR